jgi:hypothetical protein
LQYIILHCKIANPQAVGSGEQRAKWLWFPIGKEKYADTPELPFASAGTGSALERNNLGAFAGASPQCLSQRCRPTMLSQKVSERLVGELLERFHAFRCQHPELLPGFLVKLYAFADHEGASNRYFENQPGFKSSWLL